MSSQPPSQMDRHQLEVSPPCSSTTHPSPSILTHPRTSIPIDSPLKGFLAAEGHARQIISIEMLPDDVLLEISDFRAFFFPGARVSTMAKRCFCITSSPQPSTFFCTPGTPRDALDVWPALHFRPSLDSLPSKWRRATRTQRSCFSNQHFECPMFAFFENHFGNDAEAVPGADGSGALVVSYNLVSRS